MRQSYFPAGLLALGDWAANFAQGVSADPVGLGVPAPLAAEVLARQQALRQALAALQNKAQRNRGDTIVKEQAVARFKDAAREAVAILRARRDLDPQRLVTLGLKPPIRARHFVPPPADPPVVLVKNVRGNVVYLELQYGEGHHVGKPDGCVAIVLTGAISEDWNPPADQWWVREQSGKARCTLTFPTDLRPGTRVWIIAQWLTRRGETGPASRPVSAYLRESTAAPGMGAA